jgi:hypothetical protein
MVLKIVRRQAAFFLLMPPLRVCTYSFSVWTVSGMWAAQLQNGGAQGSLDTGEI